MFTQYHPNVAALIRFLRLKDVKVSSITVDDQLRSHPDWPSLLCISDSLKKWNVPNGVGRIDPKEIDDLPLPFLAYAYDKEFPLLIITAVNDKEVIYLKNGYKKSITESKDSFVNRWGGTYLIAEPSEGAGEMGYFTNRIRSLLYGYLSITLFIIMSLLPVLAGTLQHSSGRFFYGTWSIYLQYFILLLGVVVTSFLIRYEIDENDPLLKKVCTAIKRSDCSKLLTSKSAKVFPWLGWSEIGLFYFSGGLLTLLFAANGMPIVTILNLAAVPYIFFSIYYQWKVAKQWCTLCLAVQVLLAAGAINALANNFLYALPNLSPVDFFGVITLYILPILLWFIAKPSLISLREGKNIKREYFRIKFDSETFKTLLSQQKRVQSFPEGLGIDIGNLNARNSIIKVCNPFCGACVRAHPKIEELLKNNNDLKVKIIFSTSKEGTDPSSKIAKHFLSVASEKDELKTRKALGDWYLSETKDYDIFYQKHMLHSDLEKQKDIFNQMNNWCKETDITFTPTYFINGFQLPDVYNIEDLGYLLLE